MRWVWRFLRFLAGNCEVCGGRQQVMVLRAGRSVGAVMPCPHCADPADLELFVASLENRTAPVGGGAT